MIIKTDFITNSSSTVYMVYVPKNFHFTKRKIIDKFKKQRPYVHHEDYEKVNIIETIMENFNKGINILKDGDRLYPDDEDIKYPFWNVIQEILHDEGLIIKEIYISSEGQDGLIPIKDDELLEIFKLKTLCGGD